VEVHNVELKTSAVSSKTYPQEGFPEIGLVGRSNVGKSSLINKLINRNGMARTSSQPGKTQTLNFYDIEGQLYFVDVPGYGYAKVSKKQREQFGEMIEEYIQTREQLKGVVSLIDARHPPTDDDIIMHDWLKFYSIPILVVATKADKVSKSKWNQSESYIRNSLKMEVHEPLVMFSAETGDGKDLTWDWIDERIRN
jgi:GTP-binding protein